MTAQTEQLWRLRSRLYKKIISPNRAIIVLLCYSVLINIRRDLGARSFQMNFQHSESTKCLKTPTFEESCPDGRTAVQGTSGSPCLRSGLESGTLLISFGLRRQRGYLIIFHYSSSIERVGTIGSLYVPRLALFLASSKRSVSRRERGGRHTEFLPPSPKWRRGIGDVTGLIFWKKDDSIMFILSSKTGGENRIDLFSLRSHSFW